MSDIGNFQLAAIVFGSAGIWFCGFHHGKWFGIQKAEARQRLIDRTQRDLDAARKRETQR
jgi:hypothetical protein